MFNKLVFKNLKLKKLSTSLVVVASLLVAQAPFANYAEAAGAEKTEKKKRKTQLVGPRVGKKVQKAFEAYSADDRKGALVILLDIDTSKAYDQAYVARMTAIMYAQLGDNEQKTIDYLKKQLSQIYLMRMIKASL